MNLGLLGWIAVKNVIHPFRRLITWRLRHHHARFDRRMGVSTIGTLTVEELGLSPDHSHRYNATPLKFFHSVLKKLSLDYSKAVFIDLGCGKGRTLLLASHYPFRSIVGVEISSSLCRAADANVKKYRSKHQKCTDISVICKGIDEFDYNSYEPCEHTLIYIFNPCDEVILSPALNKIYKFILDGGTVTIIYLNPTCAEIFESTSWLGHSAWRNLR